MSIFEWFRTLFSHRSIIRALEKQKQEHFDQWMRAAEEIATLEQSIRCRDHALASLALPLDPESTKPFAAREVFRRPTYTQIARQYERQNSARFREIDAAAARKAAETTR